MFGKVSVAELSQRAERGHVVLERRHHGLREGNTAGGAVRRGNLSWYGAAAGRAVPT